MSDNVTDFDDAVIRKLVQEFEAAQLRLRELGVPLIADDCAAAAAAIVDQVIDTLLRYPRFPRLNRAEYDLIFADVRRSAGVKIEAVVNDVLINVARGEIISENPAALRDFLMEP